MEDSGDIKQSIDTALGKFFLACNISFSTSKKHHFIHFIDTLIYYARKNKNFTYKPPSRNTLSKIILPRIYEDIKNEKREILKNTKCVLQVDGWKSSVTNTKLLVFALTNIRTPLTYLT